MQLLAFLVVLQIIQRAVSGGQAGSHFTLVEDTLTAEELVQKCLES